MVIDSGRSVDWHAAAGVAYYEQRQIKMKRKLWVTGMDKWSPFCLTIACNVVIILVAT